MEMNFNSGDLILYSGHFEPHLRVQKFIGSKWSQVGIFIKWEGRLAIFESTKVPICKDVEKDEFLIGVQVIWFSEKVAAFNGEIAVRSLLPKLDLKQEKELMNFVSLVKGRPYNNSKFFMARGKQHRNAPGNNSSFVCSQLVAEAFQVINILQKPPIGLASGNYSPADFSSEAVLPFINGGHLSSEHQIKP